MYILLVLPPPAVGNGFRFQERVKKNAELETKGSVTGTWALPGVIALGKADIYLS